MREIAAQAAGAHAEPDDREEYQQRERGVGFQMRRRRLHAGDQRDQLATKMNANNVPMNAR